MSRNNKTALAAAIEAVGLYVATHPHAIEDGQRRLWYYTERYARRLAAYAHTRYERMCP
jgi:hypothetical protein